MLAGDVYGQNLVGFVVDKAHCVKKWYVYTSDCDCSIIHPLYTHIIYLGERAFAESFPG